MEFGAAIIDPAGVHYIWEHKGGEYATYDISFYHMTQQHETDPPHRIRRVTAPTSGCHALKKQRTITAMSD